VRSDFAGESGFSMRRVKLQQFLVNQALDAGVEFRWGTRVLKIDDEAVTTRGTFSYRWLVGADGQNSLVRKWAGLDSRSVRSKRFRFLQSLSGKAVVGYG